MYLYTPLTRVIGNQGRINAHLTGGVQISRGGGGGVVHWCATKGADRAVVYFLAYRHNPCFVTPAHVIN